MATDTINDEELGKFGLNQAGEVYVETETVTLDPLNYPEGKREDLELAKFNSQKQWRVVFTT